MHITTSHIPYRELTVCLRTVYMYKDPVILSASSLMAYVTRYDTLFHIDV